MAYVCHGFNAAYVAAKGYADEDFLEEVSEMDVYTDEIGWKMFIPPLPQHQGWGEGWCLMCDVLLRSVLRLLHHILLTSLHCSVVSCTLVF